MSVQLTVQLKRLILLVLALVVVGYVAVEMGALPTSTSLWAQQSSPQATPTWTPTWTATPFGAPTATPTATRSRKVVNEITHPGPGDAVSGFVDFRGTALLPSFRRYDVHIAVAGSESWQWLLTSDLVVRDDTLYLLDSTSYPDGFYDLRVRAINDAGDYTEASLRGFEIRNANPPTPTPEHNALGTPLPSSPLPTPTPLPTLPPTRIPERIPGGQGFYAPNRGDVLRGYVAIVGTVNGTRRNPFERYDLYISQSGTEQWNWLYGSEEQFWQQDIYVLDTTALPDGTYDLRLRIVYRDANYDEYFLRNLTVANQMAADQRPGKAAPPKKVPPSQSAAQTLGIHSPASGEVVRGVVDFTGSAVDGSLLRWEMFWSPAGADQWAFLVSSERPVLTGLLARLDLSQMPPGPYDFLLRIVRTDGNYTDYPLRNVQVTFPPTPTPVPTATISPLATPTPTAQF